MQSQTTRQFRRLFSDLPADVQRAARRAYRIFRNNPAHPGLQLRNHLTDRLDRQGFILAGGTKALGGLLEHVTTVELNYDRMLGEVTEPPGASKG